MNSTEGTSRRATGFFSMAIWFAIVTGLVEMAVPTRRYVAGSKLRLDPQIVWMAPLGDAIFFVALAAVFALAARWVGRQRALFAAVATYTWLALWSWPFLLPRLYKPAVLLLMAGVAVQLARWVMRREDKFAGLVRHTLVPLAAIVALLAVGVNARIVLRERQAAAALPAPPAGARNVILLILDTVRARSLSLYGYERPTTPNLERFATRGITFEQAIVPASWTLPTHASMFTGRWPHELSTTWTHSLDKKYPTLAEHLDKQGYATAGFVANIFYTSRETGLSRGFAHYEDYPISLGQIVVSSSIGRLLGEGLEKASKRVFFPERKHADQINEDFLGWLDGGHGGRPYFAFLNYFDAHDPYQPLAEYEKKFVTHRPRTLRATNDSIPSDEIRGLQDQYEASIAGLDARLGELFAELEKRGQLDSTVVIVTADHGEEFNEHGIWGHGANLYNLVLHVPLVIVLPGGERAGTVVRAPVTLRDMASTIVAAAGLGASPFPGTSLLAAHDSVAAAGGAGAEGVSRTGGPVLSEVGFAPRVPKWWPVSRGDMRSASDGQFHYIRDGQGGEELYDERADALEQQNLMGDAAAAPSLERLRAWLHSTLVSTGDTVKAHIAPAPAAARAGGSH